MSEYQKVSFEEAEPHWQKRKLVLRARSEALVIAMLGTNLAKGWWTNPNKAFEGQTPEAQWQTGCERVYGYLMQMAEGEW
jgi:hypothetical protein